MRSILRTSLVVVGLLAGGATLRAHEGLDAKLESVSLRIASAPGDAALWLERAEYERLQRAWRAALADLARAEALDPTMEAVELARARLFLDAGAPDRALAALDRFDARKPDHPGAALMRARALARLGRGEAAAAAFDRAVVVAQQPDPDVYFARAEHLFALGGEARARAVRGLDEGISRLGGAMQLEELALRFETELGEWDAALARVERLAAASPRPERWTARASELLERAGRPDAALAATDAALAALSRAPATVRTGAAAKDLIEELQRRRARLSKPSGMGNS